jgi:hypothetical protein
MEFLVRIVDKSAAIDGSKAGDVIAFKPDGWAWTPAEKSNPAWVIVRCPLTLIEAEALVAMDPISPLDVAPKRRRNKRIDHTRFPGITGGTGVIIEVSATFVRNRILDLPPQ